MFIFSKEAFMKKRLLSLFLLMSLFLLFLTACGSQSQPAKKGEKLHVVATTTMLTDLVSQIGGDDVTTFIRPAPAM